jgi:formylglycine-generating enzyme
MRRVRLAICLAVGCVMAANFASADTIRGINMDFVNIGNAGNAADTTGYGAVGYNYRIGTYELTNAQWNVFTAAAGVPTGNPSSAYDLGATYTGAQQPANCISWYEAAQFCNYLTSGYKSLGAYQLGTDGSITVDRASAISVYGIAYVIPTENEWYKAAYYKPNGSGYSLYANGTNTAPIAGVNSNYYLAIGTPWNVIAGTMEQNGTYNLMGNVWEWNEAFVGSSRGLRGGSYNAIGDYPASSYRHDADPDYEYGSVGFRVASVPEPATLLLLGLGGILLSKSKRRKPRQH